MIIPPALLDSSLQDGASDLCSLSSTGDLHKDTAAVVDNLRIRYTSLKACQCYTNIGSVLVSVNPGDLAGALYSASVFNAYKSLGLPSTVNLPPHVFRVAFDMYQNLLNRITVCESVVISGESGAGKTETAKKITEFVMDMNKQPNTVYLQNRIVSNGLVLEAFGNAKTARNDNSSRFGKLLCLHFDEQQRITSGASIQTFLLEKSRVIAHEENERTFHVFYYLLFCLDDDEKQELYIQGCEGSFRYLQPSVTALLSSSQATSDLISRTQLDQLEEGMHSVGVNTAELRTIKRVLSAILHLGNVSFKDNGEGHLPTVDGEKSRQHMDWACELLGIDNAQFETWMCSWKIGTMVVPRPHSEVETCRNTIAKLLYSRMFEWLVARINSGLFTKSASCTINILDIFGFEDFAHNTFEQLCINYANEKLHSLFVDAVLKTEQEEYRREGLAFKRVEFVNNDATVALLESTGGILRMLEDVCRRKTKNEHQEREQDRVFIQNLKSIQDSSSSWGVKGASDRIKVDEGGLKFSVEHYAGSVIYDANSFVSKNKDLLKPELQMVLDGSSVRMIKTFVQASSGEGTSSGNTSLTVQFRAQLEKLMQTLGQSPSFVKCIKPRDVISGSNAFDSTKVLMQLVSSGVIETQRVRAQGWNVRMSHSDFIDQFSKLANSAAIASCAADRDRVTCIFAAYNSSKEVAMKKLDSLAVKDDFHVGITLVFMKSRKATAHLQWARECQRQRVFERFHRVLQAKRKTWAFWKNLRDGALNYIADMHAKRRQLLWHTKARLLQNTYRAHLTRVRSRPSAAVVELETSDQASPIDHSKSGSAFQQKRLPSKALDIRKRKSVLITSVGPNAAPSSSPASTAASPKPPTTLATNERRDSESDAPPPLPAPLVEHALSGNRLRRMSIGDAVGDLQLGACERGETPPPLPLRQDVSRGLPVPESSRGSFSGREGSIRFSSSRIDQDTLALQALALPWYLQHMYSPSFIASEAASARDAAAAGRYDIAERKFAGVTSFVAFNVAVSRASAGDSTGAIDQLSLNITDGHVLPLILRGVCLSQTPGEGHVDASANDFENALIMCGQLQQSELDAWLCPVRPSIAALTVEVIREETKIKLALMQTRAAKQRLQTGRQSMSSFDNVFASSSGDPQHPKVPAAPQVKHSEMQKLLETTAEKISGLVRNKRRFVLYANSMCYFHGEAQVPGGEIFFNEIAEVELAGKHIIVNASERKMNVKFSSEVEAERWQAALEAQIRRVAEESAHQGRVLMVSVCKLKAQALLDQYEGPADPSFGIFVTVLAGNELRRTGVVEVQAGIAKFSEADDFCVYLPEGQQWRGNSSIKIVLMGSAHAAEGEHFKGRCFILAEGRVQLGEHFKAGAKGFLAGTSSVLCSLALPAQTANPASASSSVMRGKLPLKVVRKTTGTLQLDISIK